ncbi:hypothetical protein C8Q78DRAFT_1063627 [Trametes maxima]|nr:hypothetical protein C8Q78DRAFT_1063627 [Trametes maxima]
MPLRLLSAATEYVSFRCFDKPEDVPGGYAVLSHVWRGTEPTYDDMRAIERNRGTYDDPHLCAKVRGCRKLALEHGIPWFWIDAPCIDRRDGAELDEAIRAMYCWYEKAEICFAHLADVKRNEAIEVEGSSFRGSVYFTRGWTLQELIAPRRVVFVASDWNALGEKVTLATILEEITGIDRDILTLRRSPRSVSVARRFSWASRRRTRREEDETYCLMGLFDIHMPVLYGEGRSKAFIRLQEEILRTICDHTIFAWGATNDLPDVSEDSVVSGAGISVSPFAQSPAAFAHSGRMSSVPMDSFFSTMERWGILPGKGPLHGEILPRFVLDQLGLNIHLPVICYGSTPVAAVLACRDDTEPQSYVALALRPLDNRNLVYSAYAGEEKSSPGSGPAGITTVLALRLLRAKPDQFTCSSRLPVVMSLAGRWANRRKSVLNVQPMKIQISMGSGFTSSRAFDRSSADVSRVSPITVTQEKPALSALPRPDQAPPSGPRNPTPHGSDDAHMCSTCDYRSNALLETHRAYHS